MVRMPQLIGMSGDALEARYGWCRVDLAGVA